MEWNTTDLLEKIRSLDETRKRNVLIATSAFIMIIIVFVWIQYFNAMLMVPARNSAAQMAAVGSGSDAAGATPAFVSASASASATAPSSSSVSPAPTASAGSGQGFWHVLGNDLSGIGQIFAGGTQYIRPSQ